MINKQEFNSAINQNKIKLSIVLPVYNAEKYLEKCLDSIVDQTLTDIEIIIIDDGSIDNSAEICKSYAEKDSRIIYYRKENEGLAAARQDGIDRAKGIYVGFVDSDDWLELNMYERMVSVADQEQADIVFCNCFFDDNEKERIHLKPGVYNREDIEDTILPRTLAGISQKGSNSVIRWSNCLRLYRMDLLKQYNIRFDRRFRRSQDLQLTFEATLYANRYVSLNDEYLYHNRTVGNTNSLSRGYTKGYWELISPLIHNLYNTVCSFEKIDLTNQMYLCAFYFAATGLNNEYQNKKMSIEKKLEKLELISSDPFIIKALPYIEVSKLNEYYNMVYNCLKKRRGYSILLNFWLYEVRKKYIKPMARYVLKNKFISFVHGKIRNT